MINGAREGVPGDKPRLIKRKPATFAWKRTMHTCSHPHRTEPSALWESDDVVDRIAARHVLMHVRYVYGFPTSDDSGTMGAPLWQYCSFEST